MTPAEIDRAIDAWHALPSPPPCPLHEWLGMTWEDYARWASSPATVFASLRPAAPPTMSRRARRALARRLPKCRAAPADDGVGSVCLRPQRRHAWRPGEHIVRPGSGWRALAYAAVIAGLR